VDIGTRYTQICSVLSLTVGLTTFLATKVFLGMMLAHSFTVTSSVLVGIFVAIFLDKRLKFSEKLINAVKRTSSGPADDGIVITKYHTDIDINTRGNASLNYVIEGLGRDSDNKWLEVSIRTDSPQPSKENGFKIKVFDLVNGEKVDPVFIIDEARYKRIRINFREAPLNSGKRFKYKITAKISKSFSLNGPDFWYHKVLSRQKKVIISVSFPSKCLINSVAGKATTDNGRNIPVSVPPKKVGPRQVRWVIQNPRKGTSYQLDWSLFP